MDAIAYTIDFGIDHGLAYDMEGQLAHLGLSFRRVGNKFILAEGAIETLRKQPEDANGGISTHADGTEVCWMYGYAYPVRGVSAPVTSVPGTEDSEGG